MRNFSIVFQSNDFARNLVFPAALRFEVQDYTFTGGIPESCTIVARSEDIELLRDLLYHLRAPVDVYDENGTWVWGGYLFESRVQIEGVTRTVSLENYYNAVRVGYSTSGGQTTYTDWTTDADGITNYGRKEMQETSSSGNPTAATNYAATLLATYSKIIPQVEVGVGENQATLTCKGWFSTLEWRYYATAALGFSYWPDPMVNQDKMLGAASDRHHGVGQPLTAGAYAFDSATITLFHSGGFPQPITVALYDIGFNPQDGTLRATKTLAQTEVVWGDNTFYFPEPLYVWSAGVQFFLVIYVTTDSPSQVYYYRIDTSQTLAATQVEYDGLWSSPAPPFSIVYKLHGVSPNETRIANAIASHAAFFTGTDTVATSINADTYCDGGSTLKAVIDSLLEMGTSAGVRLLASVTEGRRLRLSAEASGDASTATLMLAKDGKLKNRCGGDIGAQNPCNQYAVFWDEIPAILTGVTRELDLSYFYVESATYNVADDAWTPTARGAIKPFDIFGLNKR